MPTFSSESEDEVAPRGKLFARERSVHALLGGGKVADLLLWRDKKISAALLIGITVIWFLFEVFEYNLVTLLCHILITTMLVIFIWSTGADILKRAPPEIPRIMLQDSTFEEAASSFYVKFKKLSEILYIACGNDLKLYFTAVLSLWLVSQIGNYISSLNILFLGLLSMETLPFLYERYEEEVDDLVRKVYRQMRKMYKKFDKTVLVKIPKGPLKEKKAI